MCIEYLFIERTKSFEHVQETFVNLIKLYWTQKLSTISLQGV